jgi:hypothetical protein
MIRLYQGTGCGEFEIIGEPKPGNEWETFKLKVCRLLTARNLTSAANLLERLPFQLYTATNYFQDSFSILFYRAQLDEYIEAEELAQSSDSRFAFSKIANTVSEIGPLIRFIAVELGERTNDELVATPTPRFSSGSVRRALADAEQLIQTRGATSGVDRVHTAFHGHLRDLCAKFGLPVAAKSSVTQLFKVLRSQLLTSESSGPRDNDIKRITMAMATIVDALNPLRNQATMAHPNLELLGEHEALLVINAVRTLFYYIDAKLETGPLVS